MIEAPRTFLVHLLEDVSSTSTSFADVTGLGFQIGAGEKWLVEASIVHQSAVNSNGLNLGFTDPAGCQTAFLWQGPTTASAGIFRHAVADDTGAAAAASPAGTTNIQNVGLATVINGSTPGTWQLRFASEGAGVAVTVKAGSALRITRLP